MREFFIQYKYFILAIAALLVLCLLGVVILGAVSDNDSPNDNSTPVDIPKEPSVLLEETEDAGKAYLDKLYFIGDSTTLHFYKGGIERSHLFVPSSGTLLLGSDILTIKVRAFDAEMTIPDAVAKAKPEILILTLGVNGANNFTETTYKTYYKKLINKIKEISPETSIIIQSVFPVTSYYKANAIGKEGIDRVNAWGLELAKECSVRFLDTQSILKDENGFMIEEYSNGDGIHMNEKGYTKALEYIRTHALK